MLIDSDSATLDPTHAYKLLIGSIIPRAVGWISSISKDGIANLEPISLFTGAGRKPPMVCLNMQPRSDGVTLKDTFVNMRDNGEFVVNMVTLEQGRKSAVVALGKQHPSGFIAWIFWCLVHVLFLIGFRSKAVVTFEWLWSFLTRQHSARLISDGAPRPDANTPAELRLSS